MNGCVGYIRESIKENEDFQEPVQNGKMDVFQRRRQSWSTSQTSWNLKDQIRENKNFKGAIRNVKNSIKGPNGQKIGDLQKRRQSWHSHVRVTYWTNERQWGLHRKHQEQQKGQKGWLQRTQQSWCIFKGYGRNSGNLKDPIRYNEDFKGGPRHVQNSQINQDCWPL